MIAERERIIVILQECRAALTGSLAVIGDIGNIQHAIDLCSAEIGPDNCPTCSSPNPLRHPAMQFEGEVHLCDDPWHSPVCICVAGLADPECPQHGAHSKQAEIYYSAHAQKVMSDANICARKILDGCAMEGIDAPVPPLVKQLARAFVMMAKHQIESDK